MPPKRAAKSTIAQSLSPLRLHASEQQRLDYMEGQLTRFVQWHEELGDSVALLENKVSGLTTQVEELQQEFKEVKGDLSRLSTQLQTAASTSQGMLVAINNCLIGTELGGVKRPGLCDDVKALSGELGQVRNLVVENGERLSSMERFRATLVWAGGGLSTLATAVALWAWTHTGQILATVSDVYGRPKTEVSHPANGGKD